MVARQPDERGSAAIRPAQDAWSRLYARIQAGYRPVVADFSVAAITCARPSSSPTTAGTC